MNIPIYQVDAFTDRPFRGNPAAVCLLDGPADSDWMQAVAAEMNLAETAFVWPAADNYRLRWFTPRAEVDLCGHATLATAHVLWETGRLPKDSAAQFDTRSGLLTASRSPLGITLDFPATPPVSCEPPDQFFASLGVDAESVRYVGKSSFDYLVEVSSEADVRAADPDFPMLAELPVRGVMVTSVPAAETDYDFVSRFFAPAVGVNEDPVTGSAHCCLGPYWAAKTGKVDLAAFQASEREGRMRVVVRDGRVELTGEAVTVLCGELRV